MQLLIFILYLDKIWNKDLDYNNIENHFTAYCESITSSSALFFAVKFFEGIINTFLNKKETIQKMAPKKDIPIVFDGIPIDTEKLLKKNLGESEHKNQYQNIKTGGELNKFQQSILGQRKDNRESILKQSISNTIATTTINLVPPVNPLIKPKIIEKPNYKSKVLLGLVNILYSAFCVRKQEI